MLYAEVMNRMATNVKDPLSERMMVCDVITMKPSEHNSTNLHEISEVRWRFDMMRNFSHIEAVAHIFVNLFMVL